MRSLTIPTGEKESQDEILRLLSDRLNDGCVAHLRALVVRDEGTWLPIGGRIDIARPLDRPVLIATPIGGARLLSETISLDELRQRLTAAFGGRPFLVAGEELTGHGMNSSWTGGRYTDSWHEYGTAWPVAELAPTRTPSRLPYLHDAYEARGEVEALDGIVECVRLALGYTGVSSISDVRGKRFGICLWDYRGVFRKKSADGVIRFAVEPPDDSFLTLSIVAHDDSGIKRAALRGPAIVSLPLAGALHRLNMTLRHGDDVVCELLWDESTERFRLRHDGFYTRPPVGPEADPIDSGSTVAEAALPFMADAGLARMVARDLAELDAAVGAGNVKSTVLLAGSILESVLLDVLNRNEPRARTALGKKWPDRASAKDLIDAASAALVVLSDGTARAILPPLTATKGAVVVDHRDLIHPRAEVRGAATLDLNTAQTMRGVLGEVLRDLREAHASGVLDAYAHGGQHIGT